MSAGAGRRRHEAPRLFGELLLEAGVVSGEGLAEGLAAQRMAGGRLGWHLMRLGRVVPAGMHLFLEAHLEAMRPDLVSDLADGAAAELLPARLAHHYGMFPVREADGVLEVGLSSTDHPGLIPAVEALTGKRVEPIICPPALLADAIGRHYPDEIEPGIQFPPAGDAVLVVRQARRGLEPGVIQALRADAPAASWLRAICAEGLRRGARRLALEPGEEGLVLRLELADGAEEAHDLPGGPLAGMTALVEGLARLAPRGRVLPREGRFAIQDEGHRVAVSALTLPGLRGRTALLHLREERVLGPTPLEHVAALPALRRAVDRLAEAGRGLLFLSGTSPCEWDSALQAVLAHLGARLPRRAVLGGWDESWPAALDGDAELLVVASPWRPEAARLLAGVAERRVVLATLPAANAFRAAEALRRGAVGQAGAAAPAGVLAARHVEALCRACRMPFDLGDLLDRVPDAAATRTGSFGTAPGCAACRGSGWLDLIRVLEYLPLQPDDLFRPGRRSGALRRDQWDAGLPTLFDAVLSEAADGRVDVREVLRLLVHEPR